MKLLVLGAAGQVGRELTTALAGLGEVVAATRDGRLANGGAGIAADLADAVSLRAALERVGADVIVNAAAYTAVDRAEDEPEAADRVNHRAVAEIGAWAKASGALVVHYSTDYVFDGSGFDSRGTRPYREDDPTAPLGVYGRSKLAGENALRDSGAAHLIFRTAWVYAAHGHNFLRTMLRLGAEREEPRVVADQIGAPTPARWIARATAEAVARHQAALADGGPVPEGIFHLVAAGRCSWFEFAEAILHGAAERGLIARTPRVLPIATADYPTRARRPAWSVLDCGRLKSAFGLELADWRAGLGEVLGEIAASSD